MFLVDAGGLWRGMKRAICCGCGLEKGGGHLVDKVSRSALLRRLDRVLTWMYKDTQRDISS